MKILMKNKNGKSLWQIAVAVLMLLMTIYFVKNEHLELAEIRKTLDNVQSIYVFLGLFITIIYLLLQAAMYVFSFKTVGINVGLNDALHLYLKRNLISVFLPAGGFSSLVFFNKPLSKKGIETSDIYYASYVYGLTGLLSVAVVALPLLLLLLLNNKLSSTELGAFLTLIGIILFIVFLAWSYLKKGLVYKFILRINPEISLIIDNIASTRLNKKHFLITVLVSIVIEFVGISHVYVSMLALGFQPSLFICFMAYIVMIMLLIASPFLRGMGAIEVTMTYVFTKSGIPTADAAAITLIFRFLEFWMPLVAGVGSFFTSKKSIVLRVLPVFIIFISGLINIFSAITPAIPSRIDVLDKLLPHLAVSVSGFMVFFTGLLLLILGYYLLRGVRRAWRITLFLLALSAIGHLVKGIDYEEATVSCIGIVSLIFTRDLYNVRSIPLLRTSHWRVWFFALIVLVIGAVGGTYFLEKNHMGINYSFVDSVKASFNLIFLFDASNYIPKTIFGRYFVLSISVFSGGLLVSGIFLSLKPLFRNEIKNDETDINHARLLAQNYGRSALDYFKYYPDKLFFFHNDGFVAYKIHRNYAVVLELPVCKTEEEQITLIREFENFASENGLRTFYYRIPEDSIELFRRNSKKVLFIGREAILNLETFNLSGSKMHPLRNAINKSKKLGYTFHIYPAPIKDGVIQKLKQVSDDWLSKPGKTETVFSQGMFISNIIKNTPVLTIENAEEKIVAFLNIIPDYAENEGTYDLIRISDDAPTGIIYYLLTELFNYFRQQGILRVNLGMVAFAGIFEPKNMAERSMKFVLENLKSLNYLKGQFQFKDKFNPDWVNKYLIYDSEYDLINFPSVLKSVSAAGN